jgi:hypothetical protein
MFGTTSTASTDTSTENGVNVFTFSSVTTPSGFPWNTLNVTPSYVSAIPAAPGSGFNDVQTASGFLSMDNPSGGLVKSGFASSSGATGFKSLFTFTVNSTVPSTFAVGLFFKSAVAG